MAADTFEGWAILELMGHRRLGGYIREQEIAGQAFLRIDVPEHPAGTCTCGSSDPDSFSHEDHRHDCFLFAPEGSAPADVHATQFYAAASVYCLTPTTEAMARAVAQHAKPKPVQRWELPALEPAPSFVGGTKDEEPDDDETVYADAVRDDDQEPF